jgi:glycine/D-amino acid oxidase-like deaminating enzyme
VEARWATSSLWSRALHGPSEPAQVPDRRFEAIVVGGGLTGLVTATVLARAGVDVVVLERHGIGGVTTRGSTGKLTALQGARASVIAEQRDADTAAAYAQASMFGVKQLRALVEELSLDCALTAAPDHTFATEPDACVDCSDELTAATQAGLPVEWVQSTDLPLEILGAVRLADQAHLDPGALCAGLAGTLGDRVLERQPVVGIDEVSSGVEVTLADGRILLADHAVVATLGPIHDPAMLATRCSAMRSYAIAAPHPSPPAGMYISLDAEPRSIRPTWIEGAPAVVVGGEGHVVGEPGDRSAAERWERLARYGREVLGAGEPAFRWAAHDLVPSDGVPFIGRASAGADRTWVATGFQKWGISTAMVAADLFLGEIEGRARPWASAFDPGRLADSVTVKLAKDAGRAVRHVVGDRIGDLVSGEEPGPRCTHMGCVLAYDADEATWDCPCHGSRYDADGKVICGPAVADLEPGDVRSPRREKDPATRRS